MAAICSAEDGDAIVKTAMEKFGGVHVLIANAGILRDKSFTAMTEEEWDIVLGVHLRLVQSNSFCHGSHLGLLAAAHTRYIYHSLLTARYSYGSQCAKAVWPVFHQQKFGRIVTTCSQVGICEYGFPWNGY